VKHLGIVATLDGMPLSLAPVRPTARAVLDPAHLRDALRANPADATLAAALRCGAAVGLALAVPGLLGRPDLAAFASLGALASLYGRYDPYRRRASLLAAVGLLLTASIAAFTALAALGVPAAVLLVGVAALAAGTTALCVLVRTGPPGATIVVFAAGAGLAGAPGLADVGPRALAGAAGALLAWVVCTVGALVRPSAPARLAVRRAVDAARVVLDGPGAGTVDQALDGQGARSVDTLAAHRARTAVARAREAVADDLSWRLPRAGAAELTAELDVVERALDDVGAPREETPAARRTTLRAKARANAAGRWRLATGRVAVAGVVAGGLASVAGLGHAAWATMGSTAVLQGDTTRHAVVRALQRGVGTVAGALLAWPLLAAPLGFWGTAAVVVALQTVTEVVVGRHYGAAMLTITPMALLMTSLAHPAAPASLALDRAVDTAVGAVVGVLAVVLVHARRGPAPLPGENPGPAR